MSVKKSERSCATRSYDLIILNYMPSMQVPTQDILVSVFTDNLIQNIVIVNGFGASRALIRHDGYKRDPFSCSASDVKLIYTL